VNEPQVLEDDHISNQTQTKNKLKIMNETQKFKRTPNLKKNSNYK
jgi:hypothetical protein